MHLSSELADWQVACCLCESIAGSATAQNKIPVNAIKLKTTRKDFFIFESIPLKQAAFQTDKINE
jgi:hypothetical protein